MGEKSKIKYPSRFRGNNVMAARQSYEFVCGLLMFLFYLVWRLAEIVGMNARHTYTFKYMNKYVVLQRNCVVFKNFFVKCTQRVALTLSLTFNFCSARFVQLCMHRNTEVRCATVGARKNKIKYIHYFAHMLTALSGTWMISSRQAITIVVIFLTFRSTSIYLWDEFTWRNKNTSGNPIQIVSPSPAGLTAVAFLT